MLAAVLFYLLPAMIVAAGLWKMKWNRMLEKGQKYPPSLPWLPIVGSFPFVNGEANVLARFFMKTAERLGPVFTFYAENKLAVVLNGKKAIVDAFFKQSEVFADRQEFWTEINRHNKELRGIIFAKYNSTFRKYHKLILSIMKEFGFGVNQEFDVRVWRMMEDFFVKLRTYKNTTFNPKNELVPATARVVMSILFGEGIETDRYISKLTNNANSFFSQIDPAINFYPMKRFLPKFRKKISIIDHHSKEILKGVQEAIAHFKANPSAENCFVKRFLEIEGPNYDHQDLVYILRDLCLGSSDTMANALTWGLIELANHPKVRARLQKEIDENVPLGTFPSYDDKKILPYAEATMLEIFRFRTTSPVIVTHATLRDTNLGEYFIPKGCLVVANSFSVHMDPELWKDPQNFRPERFLDDDMNIIGRENIFSFGIGKRSCLGETLARHEVFVLLVGLLQHFDPLPPEGLDRVPYELNCGLVVSSKNVQMRLVPRHCD